MVRCAGRAEEIRKLLENLNFLDAYKWRLLEKYAGGINISNLRPGAVKALTNKKMGYFRTVRIILNHRN